MAKIADAKGRKDGGGYTRLFEGNKELGHLMSRVSGAIISSGTELERIIKQQVNRISDLDEFLKPEIMPDGVFVADKRQVKQSQKLDRANEYPDFLIFKRRHGKQQCYVVELKDGDAFDTKKSAAERRTVFNFINKHAKKLQYTMQPYFCCFNQDDKSVIVKGFKSKITTEEALTGREFCDLLELDYDSIVKLREPLWEGNIAYFISELLKISEVRDQIVERLKT